MQPILRMSTPYIAQSMATSVSHRLLLPLRHSVVFFPRSSPTTRHQQLRVFASKNEKSWSEIASDGAELAKDVVTKVGKGIGSVLGKILPSSGTSSSNVEVVDKRVEMEKAMQQRGNELGRELFGGGLMGRMAGGLIGMAAKQMGAANARLMAVQEQAADAIEADPRVREALGGACAVGPPQMSSSMTSIVNGRQQVRVSLSLPVQGANGRAALADVQFVEGDDKVSDLTVNVRLTDGTVVRVGKASSGASSYGRSSSFGRASTPEAQQTIDVDWREV